MQHKTEIFASLVFVLFSPRIHVHVLSSPMEECASGPLGGATLPKHRQTLLSTAVVTCCSPLLCLLLLFVRQPFGVISGVSVSLLCSLKWEQAKGWSPGSIVLDRSITFSRCLGSANQAGLGDVDCQFMLTTLSREVAIAVVYQSWRRDVEPGTHWDRHL